MWYLGCISDAGILGQKAKAYPVRLSCDIYSSPFYHRISTSFLFVFKVFFSFLSFEDSLLFVRCEDCQEREGPWRTSKTVIISSPYPSFPLILLPHTYLSCYSTISSLFSPLFSDSSPSFSFFTYLLSFAFSSLHSLPELFSETKMNPFSVLESDDEDETPKVVTKTKQQGGMTSPPHSFFPSLSPPHLSFI